MFKILAVHSPEQLYSLTSDGIETSWRVSSLWLACKNSPIQTFPLTFFSDVLDEDFWFQSNQKPTIRNIIRHSERIFNADASFPIIIDKSGNILDGYHRIARAFLFDKAIINIQQLMVLPEPDFVEKKE
jgi:hypothetical protein